jgi:hypothetical protein
MLIHMDTMRKCICSTVSQVLTDILHVLSCLAGFTDLSLIHQNSAEEEINVVMDEEIDDQVSPSF